MSLTFLRHAPLSLVHQGRYNGWSDIPIDSTLLEWEKIRELRSMGEFDLVYSSDLLRCRETVDLIFDSKLKPHVTEALREVCFCAEIEGKSFDEIEKLESFKIEYLEDEERWHNYICEESQLLFRTRLKKFLATLPLNKNILICSHAGAIKEMLLLLGQPAVRINYLDWIRVDSILLDTKE